MIWILFTSACGGCSETPPAEPHYLEATAIWDAALRCDTALTRQQARALQIPAEWSPEREARAELVHGAAAWLMVAEDCEELAEGVALLVDGCGACHVEAGLPQAGPLQPASHAQSGQALWTSWTLTRRAPQPLPLSPLSLQERSGEEELEAAYDQLAAAPEDLQALEGCYLMKF